MLNQIADEKQLMSEGKAGSGTLVSNLVRASEQPQNPGSSNVGKVQKPLSILGNIFVFNFAGHDTTSISLAYALFLLVAHPEVQDWISEEINFYLGSEPDPTSWQYETTFPKLQRCLAVLVSWKHLNHPFFPGEENRHPWKQTKEPSSKPSASTTPSPASPNTPALTLNA